MEKKDKSLSSKDGDPLENAQETIDKAEECFAHVINKIDNNEVAKGLRYCGLLCNTAWESFRQVLTTYRMSCLIVKIVLSMENADFEKLCVYIESQGQAKQLSDLYYAYQLLLVSYESETHQNFSLGLSTINLQFIHLTQQIQTMIKNPTLLLEDCKRLMASKTYVTPLFKTDYLKGFNAMIDKPAVLFQALGIFWTWSDHSILKELLHMGKHMEALSRLDKFDRYLESFKSIPIGKFPLPILSSRMIPVDFSKQAHTILAIKYKNPYSKCTWQNISKLCNSVKDTFEITRNAMQLLGALDVHSVSVFTLIYWMIPTSVISLITSKITRSDYYSRLCKINIAEVAIYPKALFSADTSVKVGPLAFFMDIPAPQEMKPLKDFEKKPESLVSYLSRTEELPEIVQVLLSKLHDSQAQLAHVSFKKEELNAENKKKDADIEVALKENMDLQNIISRLEREVEILQDKEKENEKVESELKVSMALLKNELSELQSQNMIKNIQSQKLSQDNMLLAKRIRSLTEKQRTEKSRIEEEKQILVMESNQLKSEVSSLQTKNSMLAENNQALQNCREKMDKEIKVLREQSDKITTQNSNLVAENETLNNALQQQLEESHTQAQSYQQQVELLKTEKMNLSKSYNSLQQKLTKCEKEKDKLLKVACHTSTSAEHANISAQHANVSAQHANAAVALICQSRTQQRPMRSVSYSETTSKRDGNEADDSSSSVTTTGTKSTEDPTEETRYPQQEEDSLEDNKN